MPYITATDPTQKNISQDATMPHVLNYGMGVESTAILLRWLLEPETRPFTTLDQLVVLTAQTGDEFESSKILVEKYILPLLCLHNVRFVQVAKHGSLERDGYTVLDDSCSPEEVYIDGDYRLSQHLHEVGTVPLYSGAHTCAMKWKGFVLDCWLRDHLGAKKFGPYLGYNAEESKRAQKCDEYKSRGNDYQFPLIAWGWTREDCLRYIEEKLGVVWAKSCCKFCPYIAKEVAAARYSAEPEAAGFTLFTELVALALNPRMQLFSHGRAYDLVMESGNQAALDAFEKLLATTEWAVYRVERTWERATGAQSGKPFTRVNRRVVRIVAGSKESMEQELCAIANAQGLSISKSKEAYRVYSHRKSENEFPSCEGFWVVAPATVEEKVRNARAFQRKWDEFTGVVSQLALAV